MIDLLFLKGLMSTPWVASIVQIISSNWTVFLDVFLHSKEEKGSAAARRRAAKKKKRKSMQHTQRIMHARSDHHGLDMDDEELYTSKGQYSMRPTSEGINEDWVSKVGALRQEIHTSRAAAVERGRDFFNGR